MSRRFDETTSVVMDPAAVAEARHRVAGWSEARAPGVDQDVLALLVSELVTNAVLHGTAPCELRLLWDDTIMRVEVRDGGADQAPRCVDKGPDSENGRGLLLVDTLSDRWGMDLTDDARCCVWFELGNIAETSRARART